MENLNQRMGNMQLQARPGTPPAQGTYTGAPPPLKRKKHKPHQFSRGFQGKKLDGNYGTGQPPQQMPGGKRKKSKHNKRMAKKSRRRTRKKSKSRKGKGKFGDGFKAFKSGLANRTAKLRERASAAAMAARARAGPAMAAMRDKAKSGMSSMRDRAKSGMSSMRDRAMAARTNMMANPKFQMAMNKFSPGTKMPSQGQGGRKRRKKSRKKKRRKHKKKSRRRRRR